MLHIGHPKLEMVEARHRGKKIEQYCSGLNTIFHTLYKKLNFFLII